MIFLPLFFLCLSEFVPPVRLLFLFAACVLFWSLVVFKALVGLVLFSHVGAMF